MKNLISIGLIIIASHFNSCGIKTEETKPVKKDVTEMVFASGILEAKNTYKLTAQTDGYIIKLNFNEGDVIEAGNIVAEVNNQENQFNTESAAALFTIAENNTKANAPAIAQANNALTLAKQKLESDSIQLKRYKTLFSKKSVSQLELENQTLQYNTTKANYISALENFKLVKQQAEQQLISSNASQNISKTLFSNNKIKASVSGRIYEKFKQPGDYVKRGEVIATIGNADELYAKVNIDENNISKIKIGQEAIIQLNTTKEKTYKGRVTEILPSFDIASQSFLCKIEFLDKLDFKIAGTQLQSNIVIGKHKGALLIPRNFLDFDDKVTLINKSKVSVKTGFIGKDWIQIKSGIDDNTKLITENLSINKGVTSEVGATIK